MHQPYSDFKKLSAKRIDEGWTPKSSYRRIIPTKTFSVIDVVAPSSASLPQSQLFSIKGLCDVDQRMKFSSMLSQFGFCILTDAIPNSSLKNTRKVINRFSKRLISTYDLVHDEFSDVNISELNISRIPRIGKGKHNIHFDSEFSAEHESASQLAADAHFSDFLSHYTGKACCLRETGISLTRPTSSAFTDKVANSPEDSAGEGMEWHSDGARGECTVLLALDDVNAEKGCLRLVPCSHLRYVDGIGHDEVRIVKLMIILRLVIARY